MPRRSPFSAPVPVVRSTAISQPVADLKPEHIAGLKDAAAHAKAANSSRAYRSQLKLFSVWLRDNAYPPPPWDVAAPLRTAVAPRLVAAWLKTRADAGAARATLNVAAAAVSYGHIVTGQRFDRADPALTETMRGTRRMILREVRQASPLRASLLTALLERLGDGPADRRAAAILGSLYALALRRSELAGLDWDRHGAGTGVLRLTVEALEVVLLTSKGSQESAASVRIPRVAIPRIATALDQWIAAADVAPGTPLLRQLTRTGKPTAKRLSGAGINTSLKSVLTRHGAAVGLTADEIAGFSGHSGRVGFIVTAKEAGAEDSDVAETTRHKSLEMVRHYGKKASQTRRAAHRIDGVGV